MDGLVGEGVGDLPVILCFPGLWAPLTTTLSRSFYKSSFILEPLAASAYSYPIYVVAWNHTPTFLPCAAQLDQGTWLVDSKMKTGKP